MANQTSLDRRARRARAATTVAMTAIVACGATLARAAAQEPPERRRLPEPTVQQRIDRWIGQLGTGGRSDAEAIAHLAEIGVPAVVPLTKALEATPVVETSRAAAILRALAQLGPQAGEARALIDKLTRSRVRREAVRALRAVRGDASAAPSKKQRAERERGPAFGPQPGTTLVADYSENRILEVGGDGKALFVLDEVYGAWDVERVSSGNLLITEFALNRVVEVTRDGDEVWRFERDRAGRALKNPYDADRLPNGNTLIADTFGGRVLEVDRDGAVVWQYGDQEIKPYDVERLPNGDTLIADGRGERVLEVDPAGRVVWVLANMPSVHDADRLPSGNTLITQRTLHRVVEVDRAGGTVFEIENLSSPSDADRLPNGHTLVAQNGHVSEYDALGRLVWQRKVAWAVEANRYR